MKFIPHAISWNITKKCNLRCKHCYLDAIDVSDNNPLDNAELSTEECKAIMDQIASVNNKAILILTGGEPLLRGDIFSLIKYAKNLGFTLFLGTNGCLFDEKVINSLKESGVDGVGISIDSLNINVHDEFRGTKGALELANRAITLCRTNNIPFQVQTTVTKSNINEIEELVNFAKEVGASAFQLFFLVCTGRGQGLSDISAKQYEDTLTKIYNIQKSFKGSMLVSAKCAPHYKRVVYNLDKTSSLLKAYDGGCPAATNYCRITSEGDVTACPYMDKVVGNLKKQKFSEIWEKCASFIELREQELKGKCGICEFKSICKGCRARAYATNKDQLAADPWCLYKPENRGADKNKIDIKLNEGNVFGMKAEFSLSWTEEAKARLENVPSFVKGMAIRGAERYARENNLDQVTPEVMKAARDNMGKDNKTMFPMDKIPKRLDSKSVDNGDVSVEGEEEKLYYINAEDKVPWTEVAKNRSVNAPSFVRPGIYKLMQKRAKEEGQKVITTEFLSKIRNESMFLAAGRIKKFGFDDLKMEVFAAAKDNIKNEKKKIVIDEIKGFLDQRDIKKTKIISLFEEYLKPSDS